MDLSKLTVGQTVKNYKELCSLLGVKTKTGNAKLAQLSEMEMYFRYKKSGHSFIIEEVFKVPKTKLTKRFGMVTYIEELILHLLSNSVEMVFLPKSQLFIILNMVNDNYNFGRYNIDKMSKYLQIPEANIHEFYELTSSTLQRAIEGSLNRLKNKSLIFWTHAKTVCVVKVDTRINENADIKVSKTITQNHFHEQVRVYTPKIRTYSSHREANSEEIRGIIHTEHEVLHELNCKDKSEVIKMGKWEAFKSKVDTILLDKYNIDYYYDSYKIYFNEEHIKQICLELSDLFLNEIEKENSEKKLNDEVKVSLNGNAKERVRASDTKLSQTPKEQLNDKYKMRLENKYLRHNDELIHNLIDDEPKEKHSLFRDSIRSIKVNKYVKE